MASKKDRYTRPEAIGIVVKTAKGDVTITKRLMTEYTDYKSPSTFYEGTLPDGTVVPVHENDVHGTLDGTYTYEPSKPKGPRKTSTKKERAAKHVKDAQRKRMSRGETIKLVAQKLRVSRSTAQSYYYLVK